LGLKAKGNENVKIVFCSYFCQKWIDLRQTKTEMMNGPFCTLLNTFHQQKCFVLGWSVISDYPGRPHVAAATWSCVYLCLVLFSHWKEAASNVIQKLAITNVLLRETYWPFPSSINCDKSKKTWTTWIPYVVGMHR